MVGLDEKLAGQYAKWTLRPESIGKKYMLIESMSGHMSVYPVFYNDDIDIRLHIKRNIDMPLSGLYVLYVVNLKSKEIVYSQKDGIDELDQFIEDDIIIASSMGRLGDLTKSLMLERDREIREFAILREELRQRMVAENYEAINKHYAAYVNESYELGYPIKSYHEFLTQMHDEDTADF